MTTGKRLILERVLRTARRLAKDLDAVILTSKQGQNADKQADHEYVKRIDAQVRATKGRAYVEHPEEVVSMLGLELWEFEVLTGDEAHNADVEIFMDFQGKEMRIYIDLPDPADTAGEDGVLSVYTD